MDWDETGVDTRVAAPQGNLDSVKIEARHCFLTADVRESVFRTPVTFFHEAVADERETSSSNDTAHTVPENNLSFI